MYHYRERAQPTIAEIQLAKAQLDELEHRFRVRVEEGYSGAPLPSPSELVLSSLAHSHAAPLIIPGQNNGAAALQALLMGIPPSQVGLLAPAPWYGGPPVAPGAAPTPGQWLLPNVPNAIPVSQ